VQLPRRNSLQDARDGLGATGITVRARVAEQASRTVEEREVHRPGVDRHGTDPARATRSPEAVEHVRVEPEYVPVERSARPHGNVRETVDLLDRQTSVGEAPHRNAPGLRAELGAGEHLRALVI